ncbi:hypothetical protein C4K14_2134 [Pseudomonas chlororaphis subsp. aureofaciens]|uniref:hypothetical protein n=1 Tax=Pseudomonas chlororaphis TaxID=587753 RepID=UPI000F6EF583|nr:hypothetical protein [Pseudomonas chlororaphis]AZD84968.1 hypothetical protein C4K14_2134 [Pseudomonas chlororaphis subsp. aureofaciens]
MNSLTFRTLEEAFAGRASVPVPTLIPPVQANPPLPEIVISGPINRVMELEGKRYAMDVVRAAGADVRKRSEVEKLIRNLTNYAVAQPSSVAHGIKGVIDLLRSAL